MSKTLWRIAADTPDYGADDNTGAGAEKSGGRWNRKGTPAVYCSETTAMAVLETIVHFKAGSLPLNRYLVQIKVPESAWRLATVWTPSTLKDAGKVAWDALPAGRDSIDYGNDWLIGKTSPLLLVVPSVIVPHERNIVINPKHPAANTIVYTKLQKWIYDARCKFDV